MYPESKIHGANMGPIRDRQDPGGPHVGPMNFAIWDCKDQADESNSATSSPFRWNNVLFFFLFLGNITLSVFPFPIIVSVMEYSALIRRKANIHNSKCCFDLAIYIFHHFVYFHHNVILKGMLVIKEFLQKHVTSLSSDMCLLIT